ncbi:hypothetical protein GCM10009624_04030 [Gordonia sinesedis]
MAAAHLDVDPSELMSAASDLDRLADQLEGSVRTHTPALAVHAAGRDEVSVTTADTFDVQARRFGEDSASAVRELRKIAAVLRDQATGFVRADDDAAAHLRA